MVSTAALAQAPQPVQVDFTHLGTFKDESVRIDDECWVTPALLDRWGFVLKDRGDRLEVSFAGRAFDLPLRRIDAQVYANLHEAARLLGADVSWNEGRDSLTVLAQLRIVESVEEGMRIDLTLPVQPLFAKIGSPDRFVIDLKGAKLPSAGVGALPTGWRVGQLSPGIVRVVVESPETATQFLPTMKPARAFLIKLGSEPFEQIDPTDEASSGGIKTETPPPDVQVTAIPKAQSTVSLPNISREDDAGTVLMMPYTGTLASSPSAKYLDPTRIQVSVPMAAPSSDGGTQAFESKRVGLVTASRDQAGSAVFIFNLNEPCAFELKNNDRVITLRVFKPKEATGKLANKVIVVDAGHGGRETGTKWGNILEKDLTLKVAKKLAAYLTDAGASVVMIRNEDTLVPLLSRPETANESKADLYISVHFNSNQTANSVSGGITFYHMQNAVSMLLAQCIQTQIASVSKIPDLGVWSDSRIYKTKGFAVLRLTSMPAVLIELGFLNNAFDRKRLVQAEFHDAVAKAIVKGVKVFLGETDGKKQ
jgi:N-acetylmuramoyl-L-alanine amidase